MSASFLNHMLGFYLSAVSVCAHVALHSGRPHACITCMCHLSLATISKKSSSSSCLFFPEAPGVCYVLDDIDL